MKRSILFIVCALMAQISFSQKQANKDIKEVSFEVDGVCKMCKERIENAAMRTKGVKMAEWDLNSHHLTVVYKPSKTSEEDLHKAVSSVGHDTQKMKAKDDIYDKIHACCHYRDEEVKKDHQDGKANQ